MAGKQETYDSVPGGRLYTSNDMVKVGCGDCEGCSTCCEGMGQSVVLTPWDVFQMVRGSGKTVTELFQDFIEFHVEEGMIVPNLQMTEERDACVFLSAQGRCMIHPFRPGICRLFPLGRKYGEKGGEKSGEFCGEPEISYFLLEDSCPKENKSKVKVKKWLDVSELKEYEKFLGAWYTFCRKVKAKLTETADEDWKKKANLYVLQSFYFRGYESEKGFYGLMEERMAQAADVLEL
ncbi:MAG: YkgJ family cysteine cluster protein [bacterium]|nr:YkgJ family cysteine cluster protein [bacterium]